MPGTIAASRAWVSGTNTRTNRSLVSESVISVRPGAAFWPTLPMTVITVPALGALIWA